MAVATQEKPVDTEETTEEKPTDSEKATEEKPAESEEATEEKPATTKEKTVEKKESCHFDDGSVFVNDSKNNVIFEFKRDYLNLFREIEKAEGIKAKNLGRVYKQSFSYEKHEQLLQLICEANSKILISNYDVDLYNTYLTPDRGWKRLEFETTTAVGSKGDNRHAACGVGWAAGG